jgi:tetratricopeptide (TPR) repeat protein
VRLALHEAIRLQEQARWPEALSAARRAEGLLASGPVSDGLQQTVQERRKDLEMVAKLEDVHVRGTAVINGHFDNASRDAAYREAFAECGIDVATLAPQEAAERIRKKSIRVQLAAALDDWALARRTLGKKVDPNWKTLLDVAREADPDPRRNEVRDAIKRQDLEAMKKLAGSDGIADLPPSTLLLLGLALERAGAFKQQLLMLRKAQRRYPADFWINTQLGWALANAEPPAVEDAIRFFTAAMVLRPRSPGAHLNLGQVLSDKGVWDEAIAALTEAIHLKPTMSRLTSAWPMPCGKKATLTRPSPLPKKPSDSNLVTLTPMLRWRSPLSRRAIGTERSRRASRFSKSDPTSRAPISQLEMLSERRVLSMRPWLGTEKPLASNAITPKLTATWV